MITQRCVIFLLLLVFELLRRNLSGMEEPRSNTRYIMIVLAIMAIAILIFLVTYCKKSPSQDLPSTNEGTTKLDFNSNSEAIQTAKPSTTPENASPSISQKASDKPLNDTTNTTNNTINPDTNIVPNANKPIAGSNQKAITTAELFINAITELDAKTASQYIDSERITYATIAGLCMMFEDGDYTFLEEGAIRKMFANKTSAGFLARVQTKQVNEQAMFSLSVKRKNQDDYWKITEINLDEFLSSYVDHISDGDIHYTPLIKKPQGGQALAIYFGVDSDELTIRTTKQLSIVADLLIANPEKKLTISGHTDSLGSDDYNFVLSEQRAQQVKTFLSKKGLPAEQINIIGFGKTKPRAANTTSDGNDSPAGRRANRRAEIFLDF